MTESWIDESDEAEGDAIALDALDGLWIDVGKVGVEDGEVESPDGWDGESGGAGGWWWTSLEPPGATEISLKIPDKVAGAP